MATSKKKPVEKPAKNQDAPTAKDPKDAPRTKKVAAPVKKASTYTVTLVEGASLTRKGINFVNGRPVPMDEATYRLFENNGRFSCVEREGGAR